MTDEVIITEKDTGLVAAITCEIDHYSAKRIRERVDPALFRYRPKVLVLDFSEVRFMDSSGIALILRAQQRMQMLEGSVLVCNVPQQARRVLDAAGIGRLVTIK